MDADKSRTGVKRKALADCTNTITKSSKPSASSDSILKPTNPSLASALKRILNQTDPNTKSRAKSAFTIGSTADQENHAVQSEKPSSATSLSVASTPPRSHNSFPVSGTGNPESVEPPSVYTRRRNADKRKSKEKATAAPMSCPPVAKILRSENKMNKEGNTSMPKSCRVSHKRKKCQTGSKEDLQDFIEQQKAYFAEIDAFELQEEEVESDS